MKSELSAAPKFFLGANSPCGFVSRFEDSFRCDGHWHTYIIKGGPGTGKSTLMKRVADYFIKKGARRILCPCSSDPASLDGVIFPDMAVTILDGTFPHVVEPKYPGAAEEIINLGECWDVAALQAKSDEIMRLTDCCRACHKRASGYLAAAGRILADSAEFAKSCCDIEKINRFSRSLAKRTIPKTHLSGSVLHRYLSAVTPRGHIFYSKTIDKLCDDVFVISDELGAVAPVIIKTLTDYAVASGHEAIACLCPLSENPKYEHLIIPSLRLGFVTSSHFHPYKSQRRTIHARRFVDMQALHSDRGRLKFNRRATTEMLYLAADTMEEAKEVHDTLEKCYISAMHYEELNKTTEAVVKSIILNVE